MKSQNETLSGLSDSALMLRFRDGDIQAFNTLFERYVTKKKYISLLVGKPELADEAFQETWERIIKTKDRYEPTASFHTFFNTVLRNVIASHYRKSANKDGLHISGDQVSDPDSQETTFDGLSANNGMETEQQSFLGQCVELLHSAIGRLPIEQRESLLLKIDSGFGLEEIANITKTTRETAKSRLRYGLKKLRNLVPEECYG